MWVLGLKSKPPPQSYDKDFSLQVIYATTLPRHRLIILLTGVNPFKKKKKRRREKKGEKRRRRRKKACFENTI